MSSQAKKGLAAFAVCAGISLSIPALSIPARAAPVTHENTTVNGQSVIRFTWTDSKDLPRTVDIKQEGNGNPQHGGYALQVSYQFKRGDGSLYTVRVTGYFGLFESRERVRTFTDGTSGTIASRLYGTYDGQDPGSSLSFATLTIPPQSDPDKASIIIRLKAHHYGTIDPIPKGADGEDVRPTPTDKSQLADYILPVTMVWSFQSGTDYPRIQTHVSLRNVAPDRVNFNVRGPLGEMNYAPHASFIEYIMWGDRYRFQNLRPPVTGYSDDTWSVANDGARYNAVIDGAYEFGLFEPRPFRQSSTADDFSAGRGNMSCDQQPVPCPYRSLQEDLFPDDAGYDYAPIGWGSTSYYGTGPSLTKVYDTKTTYKTFDGHPDIIRYDVCVVAGRTIAGGLTVAAARSPANYSCAAAQ